MPPDEEEIYKEFAVMPFKMPWHERLLMKLMPMSFLRLSAGKIGVDSAKIDLAYKLFEDCKRVDIQPLSGPKGRGFIISLDNKLTLWFFQDGDHLPCEIC